MRFPLLFTTILLLAGCVGAPDDAGEANAAATNATAAPAAVPDANATLPPVETPLAFDGKVPQYARLCAFALAVAECVGAPPGADHSASFLAIVPTGSVRSGTVTATWTPTGPTTQEMVLSSFSYNDDAWQAHGWAIGPPGLTLELEELAEFAPGGTLVIALTVPGEGVGSDVAAAWASGASSEQPFRLEGLLVTEAAPQP